MSLKNRIISCIFVSILIVLFITDNIIQKTKQIKEPEIEIIENVDTLKTYTNPKQDLYKALIDYEIHFPDIVYAQAVLETGNFTSDLCLKHNNLFGLYDSKNKKFFEFHHWIESVEAYKNKIQYKYKCGEDYFKFLDRIGYAEDTLYVSKLKRILSNETSMCKGCIQ